MQSIYIDKQLKTIEQSLEWEQHVPESERLNYRQKLINIRRELKKIKYAVEERPSTAAFGESQMGKSYLVSAMLSSPDKPFCVTNGSVSYNFIDAINPSSPNSTIEATGVITRFTTNNEKGSLPDGYLKAQLLSVSDIVLMLCEAYYNQIDYSHENILDSEVINKTLYNMVLGTTIDTSRFMNEDDVLDIREYLQISSIQKKCHHILNSDIFNYFLLNVDRLSNIQLISALKLLWNNNVDISRVFDDLIKVYSQLGFETVVYTKFDSVLKKHGTLLDVARLDEMYGAPEVIGNDYRPNTEVKLSSNDIPRTIPKSFFIALIAELCFSLPTELCDNREFLHQLDILDFPGARRPEQIKESKLNEGKNLSTVLRRGKVSYLFNKYSAAKRISTLLFCHNNNQSAESTMGTLLNEWVMRNIGENTIMRNSYIQQSKLSPLFIIGTWFNKELDFQNEVPGDKDRLNERWQRRFNVVLEKEVLKSVGDTEHWFNHWTSPTIPFQNIYMLRDFKYSKGIFEGYDPDEGTSENEPISITKYPNFLQDLRTSFISNDFVHAHFVNPGSAWNEAATVGQDGTRRIINGLSEIAPNVSTAREDKFMRDLNVLAKDLRMLLEQYYHPESSDEQLKQAKRQAGAACLQIDRLTGIDSYFFGRLIDTMMIKESEIYELVHQQILGAEQALPMSNVESTIFMGAGLDTSASREENIKKLCDYLGMSDEDDCRKYLIDEGVEMENLLSQCQMVAGRADKLVEIIEELWHEKFLQTRCVDTLKDKFNMINNVVSNLWSLYLMLNLREKFVARVNSYIQSLDKEVCVGILADYLAMSFNAFVNSFGYEFLSDETKQNILKQNKELQLNLDENMLEHNRETEGVSLLADLYQQKERLSSGVFGTSERQLLMRFPQYNQMWRWQQRLRLGYIYACSLPDYDVKANDELKNILKNMKE